MFHGATAQELVTVQLGSVFYVSLVHMAAFTVIGGAMSLLVHEVELHSKHPIMVLGVLFVVVEGALFVGAPLAMPSVIEALGMVQVTAANLLAAATAIGTRSDPQTGQPQLGLGQLLDADQQRVFLEQHPLSVGRKFHGRSLWGIDDVRNRFRGKTIVGLAVALGRERRDDDERQQPDVDQSHSPKSWWSMLPPLKPSNSVFGVLQHNRTAHPAPAPGSLRGLRMVWH